MLQAIRNKAQSWIAWVIVGLIILTFALFGIDQYAKGERALVIATVNSEDITATEFLALYSRQTNRLKQQFGEMYDQVVNDEELRKEVLNALIESKVVGQWSEDRNMFISDQQLAMTIHSAAVFQENGQFDKDLYKNILLRSGLNVARFEYEQRQYLIENQFRQLTMSSGFILPHQVEHLTGLQLQERKMNYLRIDQRSFKETIDITEQQVIDYYEKNKRAYVSPEKVKIEYILLSQSEIAKNVIVTIEDLEKFYVDNSMAFSVPEKRQASHILIQINEGVSSEEALKEIQAIQAEIKTGKDFAELAKERSQDPGSAKMGGDLGLFQQGMMVLEFDEAVFDLKVGEVSPPVKTEFGYHLIKVTKIEPRKTQAFAEVKDRVEQEYRLLEAEKKYFELLEQMNVLAFEQPDTLIAAAEAVGVDIIVSDAFSRQGGATEMTAHPKVIAMSFSEDVLKYNLNSASIDLSPTSSVIVRLSKHIPERQKPLDEVKSKITAELKREAMIKASEELANTILAELKAGKGDLKSHEAPGVEWSVEGWLGRENRNVLPQITTELFKMIKPEEGQFSFKVMQLTTGDSIVLELSGVRQAEEGLTSEQKSEVKRSLTGIFSLAEVEARIKALVAVADVEKRVDLLTIR